MALAKSQITAMLATGFMDNLTYTVAGCAAIEKQQNELLRMILTAGGANADSLLSEAIENNNIEALQIPLDWRDRQNVNNISSSCLDSARYDASPEAIKLLIAAGHDPDVALCGASRYNQNQIADIALSHGADVNANNGEPLHNAIGYGNFKLANTLLDHGTDVNVNDCEALRRVARMGDIEMLRSLGYS